MEHIHFLLLFIPALYFLALSSSDYFALPSYFGLFSLILLLFVTALPRLAKLFRLNILRYLCTKRKELGIYSFIYITLHVFFVFEVIFAWNLGAFSAAFFGPNFIYYLSAILAYLIVLIMAITSNRFSIQKLKFWWKKTHNLVYLAIFLIIIHTFGLAYSFLDNLYLWLFFALISLSLIAIKLQLIKL